MGVSVILVEPMCPLIAKEGDYGVLIHIHHAEPMLIEPSLEVFELFRLNIRRQLLELRLESTLVKEVAHTEVVELEPVLFEIGYIILEVVRGSK